LQHLNVCLREQMRKNAPRAMIQAPLIAIETDPRRLRKLRDLLCQLRQTRSRILEGKQLLGETVKVVDRARPLHRRHRGGTDEPVSRYRQNCARSRQSPPDVAPGLRVAVDLERVHRTAMPDEQYRKARHALLLWAIASECVTRADGHLAPASCSEHPIAGEPRPGPSHLAGENEGWLHAQ